jgi:hypothetical protein
VDNLSRTIAMAFACDRTRVASLQLHDGLSASDFGGGGDVHQDVAHGNGQPLVRMYTMHATEVATLLGHLRSVPEADGRTLLDHTTVVWGQECGTEMHDTTHLAVVVAGGGFRMGRYIHYNHEEVGSASRQSDYNTLGPAMSKLLVSVAQRMGVPVDRIGNATSGAKGASLTGPLPRLT